MWSTHPHPDLCPGGLTGLYGDVVDRPTSGFEPRGGPTGTRFRDVGLRQESRPGGDKQPFALSTLCMARGLNLRCGMGAVQLLSKIGHFGAETGEFCQIWPNSSRNRPNSTQHLHGSTHTRRNLGPEAPKLDPNLARVGQHWSDMTNIAPIAAGSGHKSARFGQHGSGFDRNWLHIGQIC